MRSPLALLALLASCAPAPSPTEVDPAAAGMLARALGEVKGDRPSYIERTVLYVHNRARVDPEKANTPGGVPARPLLWHDDLARASRDHAVDMRDQGCFQADACDGTSFKTWVKAYWTEPLTGLLAFVAGGPGSPQKQVQGWIDEGNKKPPNALLAGDYHWAGVGFAEGGKNRGYWTELLVGVADPPAVPRLPSGSHYPDAVQAGEPATFGVIYYDEGGVEPESVELILDGETHPLELAWGVPSAGAWEGKVAITNGCHRYYFRATADGDGFAYPDGGTLVIGSDDVYTTCKPYQKGGVDAGGGCAVAGRNRASTTALLGLALALGLLALRLRRRP